MSIKTNTWADGFGRWHARVPVSDSATETRQARKAIRDELRARGAIGYGCRLRVTPAGSEPINGTVEYREL